MAGLYLRHTAFREVSSQVRASSSYAVGEKAKARGVRGRLAGLSLFSSACLRDARGCGEVRWAWHFKGRAARRRCHFY
jgi:hypothetical protein